MDESARKVADDFMEGAMPYLYCPNRVTSDVQTHPPSPCCGPVFAGQRKSSPSVMAMLGQRVERTLRLQIRPTKASLKLPGVEALTHELLLAVLEALEVCTDDAIDDGEPAPTSRDKCRAFA
jgi:hypothetical protein